MKTAVLNSASETDLKLLAVIAKKMGIKFRMLSTDEAEDIGLYNAMKHSSGKNIDVDKYLKKLRGK